MPLRVTIPRSVVTLTWRNCETRSLVNLACTAVEIEASLSVWSTVFSVVDWQAVIMNMNTTVDRTANTFGRECKVLSSHGDTSNSGLACHPWNPAPRQLVSAHTCPCRKSEG